MKQLSRAIFVEGEKTELIIGICTIYPHLVSLETSNLQPIDQGIIKAGKL